MSGHLEAKSSVEGVNFQMAPTEAKADDSSTGKNVPRCIGQMCSVLRRGRRL